MVDERPDEPTEEEGDPHHAEAADSAQVVEGDDEGLVDTEVNAAGPAEEDADVAELAEELEAAKDAALRAQADAMNVQRRAEQEIEKARKFALERFCGDLLSVVDNLERALESSDDEQGGAALAEGVELTRKGFMDVLAKYGVEAVDPTGEPFDPETAQAMSMVEQPDAEPNSVVAVMQKGYLLNGRLLRPAMVMVAKAPSAE
jgi:molecular chaperone GrpE